MYVSFALLHVNVIILSEQTQLYCRITFQNPLWQCYQENLLKTERINLLNCYERTL
jgi:hypothetical protein